MISGSKKFVIFDLYTQTLIHEFTPAKDYKIRISFDNLYIIGISENIIKIWDFENKEILHPNNLSIVYICSYHKNLQPKENW